jgi:flavin reductase (DIM6/NTAB) family NADH-FMN oxidoreductase RutF
VPADRVAIDPLYWPAMPVSPSDFRQALARFAAGVTVVTTCTPEDQLAGITVTAFSSLSLDPPLVLVCIDRRAWLHDRLPVGGAFAVNLLAEDQEEVSRLFASREREPFSKAEHSLGATGVPLLAGTIGAIECRIVERLAGGDHTIVVGQVEATTLSDGQPLTYFRGAYRRLVE